MAIEENIILLSKNFLIYYSRDRYTRKVAHSAHGALSQNSIPSAYMIIVICQMTLAFHSHSQQIPKRNLRSVQTSLWNRKSPMKNTDCERLAHDFLSEKRRTSPLLSQKMVRWKRRKWPRRTHPSLQATIATDSVKRKRTVLWNSWWRAFFLFPGSRVVRLKEASGDWSNITC